MVGPKAAFPLPTFTVPTWHADYFLLLYWKVAFLADFPALFARYVRQLPHINSNMKVMRYESIQ